VPYRERNEAMAGTQDMRSEPFRRLVILGESTVEGGPWLGQQEERFADVVARLIAGCQGRPLEYYNKGIGANAISPRSPGYEQSAKPSALERYRDDVIALEPDLFVLCYGLNDMRAGMPVEDFREDMATIIRDVQVQCNPLIVLTTVYHMTAWKSYAPFDRGSPELTREYNACIAGLAEEHDCVRADVWEAQGQTDWLINQDGVHANTVGNLVIAHCVFEAIAQHASGLCAHVIERDNGTDWAKGTMAARDEAGDPYKKTW